MAAGLLTAGCIIGESAPACETSAEAGITVVVHRADTGEPICDATVDASSGDHGEPLAAQGSGRDCRYVGAWDRAGEFTLLIAREGFRTKLLVGVNVTSEICHVTGTLVDVELSPVGAAPEGSTQEFSARAQ